MTHNAKGTEVINTPLNIPQPKYTGISWLDNLTNKIANKLTPSPITYANRKLKAHTIDSIFGRGKCGKTNDCKCASAFKQQLEDAGLTCADYLSKARAVAKKAGYNPSLLEFSNDPDHKLMYASPDGSVRRFGRVSYGDFIIWSYLESEGIVPKGTARKKRSVFHKSHEAITGDWRNDKYSPNRLALQILW